MRASWFTGAPESRLLRVAAPDGTALSCELFGEGTDLVITNGLSGDCSYWRAVLPRIAPLGRITLWDLPGHGRSEAARRPEELTIERCAESVERIMDAVGAREAILVGFSLGCQIVLEAWRRFPERIRAVALILGSYERPFDNLLHPRVGPLIGRTISRLGPLGSTAAIKAAAHGARLPGAMALNRALRVMGAGATDTTMAPYIDHLHQIHGPTWAALARAVRDHSTRDVLETITVPATIVSGGNDVFTPPAASDVMESAIPDVRRVHIEEAAHTGLVEHPEAIASAIEELVSRAV